MRGAEFSTTVAATTAAAVVVVVVLLSLTLPVFDCHFINFNLRQSFWLLVGCFCRLPCHAKRRTIALFLVMLSCGCDLVSTKTCICKPISEWWMVFYCTMGFCRLSTKTSTTMLFRIVPILFAYIKNDTFSSCRLLRRKCQLPQWYTIYI